MTTMTTYMIALAQIGLWDVLCSFQAVDADWQETQSMWRRLGGM